VRVQSKCLSEVAKLGGWFFRERQKERTRDKSHPPRQMPHRLNIVISNAPPSMTLNISTLLTKPTPARIATQQLVQATSNTHTHTQHRNFGRMAGKASLKRANDFTDFLNASPTPFHAVHSAKLRLEKAGFKQIKVCDCVFEALRRTRA
jgi:hypothetical protein